MAVLRLWLGACISLALGTSAEAFCSGGVQDIDLQEDNGKTSVNVMIAQAPLLSDVPQIGNKLGWFGAYHTSVIFRQDLGGITIPKYWTLEFDGIAGSVFNLMMPEVVGDQLKWNSDARFCLTRNIMWGRDHWSKAFDSVAALTANQTKQLFQEFVRPLNASSHGVKPQYQMWRVAKQNTKGESLGDVLVGDVTCSNGPSWLLHYVQTHFGVQTPPGYVYRSSSAVMHAATIEPVNSTDPFEWAKVVNYYKQMAGLLGKSSKLDKLWDLFQFLRHEYVYDTNEQKYFRLHGNRFPWYRMEYLSTPIVQGPLPYKPVPASESIMV